MAGFRFWKVIFSITVTCGLALATKSIQAKSLNHLNQSMKDAKKLKILGKPETFHVLTPDSVGSQRSGFPGLQVNSDGDRWLNPLLQAPKNFDHHQYQWIKPRDAD